MAPVTKQNKQTSGGGGGGTPKRVKWWLYISIILVLVLAITVVSSYVLKMDGHSEDEGGQASSNAIDASALLPSVLQVSEGASSQVAAAAAAPIAGGGGGDLTGANSGQRPIMAIKTQVPVIGVLSQVLRDYKRFTKEHHLHIAASYVKWIESAGAQVVPILLNQNDFYYEQMFKQTNGLLLPGGDNLLDPAKSTPMMVAARKLYKLAVEANEAGHYYPIWGTCLGLELLSVLSSNKNVLDSCVAVDESLPMNFVARGKLFAPAPYANLPELGPDFSQVILDILSRRNLTYNFHRKCLTDGGLERAGLSEFYRPLAYSTDADNNKFIAIFEAVRYPFYGVQFHPEKPSFEFVVKHHQHNIPHSREAIAVSRFFADFFIQQAQLNDHQVDRALIQNHLIYAHAPRYTAPLRDMYEQRYLFPFGSDFAASTTEEFIEHLVDDDEVVPEEVHQVVLAAASGSHPTAAAAVATSELESLQVNNAQLTTKVLDLPNASDGLPQRDFYILSNVTVPAPPPPQPSQPANVTSATTATTTTAAP